MADESLKKTPLNAIEHELGGKMIDFGGWELPVQFTGIIEEHQAVRTRAGLFDVSHMGEILVRGAEALALSLAGQPAVHPPGGGAPLSTTGGERSAGVS